MSLYLSLSLWVSEPTKCWWVKREWFCLDPPRGEEYWTASSDEFKHAVDLIKYIRKTYHQEFCIGVAGNDCFPFPLTSIRSWCSQVIIGGKKVILKVMRIHRIKRMILIFYGRNNKREPISSLLNYFTIQKSSSIGTGGVEHEVRSPPLSSRVWTDRVGCAL